MLSNIAMVISRDMLHIRVQVQKGENGRLLRIFDGLNSTAWRDEYRSPFLFIRSSHRRLKMVGSRVDMAFDGGFTDGKEHVTSHS